MDHQHSRKQMASPDVALANEVFDQFCNATTLKSILGHFRHLCELLKIKPTHFHQFYPKLKSKLRSWKAQALWKKFDQRANHKCYNRGKACLNTRVLIIGGGPCGMRSAIEAQLLGAKVVVVEKRDRMSRNNVLHLWPFVIQDLRALGAKKFFGKFCAGSIDHISIRQLQCILLKVALILGVEFHESVSFEALVPPPENQADGKIGWRAKTVPADHPVSQYEFDVLIGADGKRNTLEGFKRKEFRGKLAIAITANFINKRTEAEARVEEISGVAFIFNQKFFKELYQETGIDLENIVYYKDDTHYFVMTAKKHSLIDKGVILQDHADTAKLLAKENVDREALMLYAREAAEFSTEYQMMDMEFAVNHYGQPDVAMFDFTSMYAAENASRVLERCGHRLFMTLVGDSLLEPFWPTGSGCARGFLSSLDACWAIKGWGGALTPLEVIAERESIYRLLGQTTPENLNRDYAAYTLDPHTRYPNLNVRSVTTVQVRSLLDTDDPETFKLAPVQTPIDLPKKRRRRDSQVHPDTLLHWLQRQVALYDGVRIQDMGVSFKNGLAIAAIINRYRPDLIDFHALKKDDPVANNQLAFDILEKELGIPPIMTGEEMVQCEVPDKLTMFSYLTQIYEAFRGEIPHIKHPKLEPETEDRPAFSQKLNEMTAERKAQLLGRLAKQEVTAARTRRSRHVNENLPLPADKKNDTMSRRHARKRRSTEKMGATVEERMQRLQDIEKNRLERMLRRQYQRKRATQQFYKSMQMLQANAKRDKDEPFEDYSIFLYRQTAADFKDRVKDLEQKILYPDREPKLHAGHHRGSTDEGFSGRIKNIEEKLKGTTSTEKKPKDLLRAIGKIEKTDWNVKEIEKKIEENKMGRSVRTERVERVPKWSREQFLARQTKMEKKGREPMETDSKYADIDNTLKSIERKNKEGNVLGHNKVSAMAEQFANKNQDAAAADQPKVQRSNSKVAVALPTQGGSEMCHFCEKRVYLMERLTAEGKSFHRGCFRCEYCSISLRIGNHTFDRDKTGGRFYCSQHFGLPGTMKTRIEKKKTPLTSKENIPQTSNSLKPPEKGKLSLEGISGLDLLDRGQTPERIEFENLAGMSDAEEAQSIMDEDEWTDRNFGPSAAEMGSSDDISDMSDSDEDNEVFEEAIDQPLTTEGTLELAKNWTLRYSHPHPTTAHSDTGSNEYEDSSDEYTSTEEDSQTATEDEEEVRARELRKKEVWLQVPFRSTDTETGSETEVKLSQISNGVDETPSSLFSPSSAQTNLPLIVEPSPRPRSASSLPDAVPSEIGSQLSLEVAPRAASSAANLPDLVASSPKLSRQSSQLSLASEDASFASLEDPRENESPHGLSVTIAPPPPSDDWLELEEVLSKSDAGLARPILTITAPTPTSERPADSPVLEPSRLVVPKEKQPQREESPSDVPTSFDNLLQELRQRKAKNKAEAEAKEALKPLTTESAKLQMSKYFETSKVKSERRLEKKPSLDRSEETSPTPSPRRRLSDKIEKKDILKYFAGSSFESTTSSKSRSPVSEPIANGDSRRSLSKDENDDKTENNTNIDFDDDLPVFPRPRISDKVDRKDLLKYFKGASMESKSSVKSGSPIMDDSSIIIDSSAAFENDSSELDVLDLVDIDFEADDIEREFNEIEQQNKNNLELLEIVEPTEPLPKTEVDLFDDLVMTDFDTAFTEVPPPLKDECQLNDDTRNDIDLSSFPQEERKSVTDGIDSSILKDEQVTPDDELSKDIDQSTILKEEKKLDLDERKIETAFEEITKSEPTPVNDNLTEKSPNIFKAIDTTVDLIPASSRILQSIMNKTDRAKPEVVVTPQVDQPVFSVKLDSEIFAEKAPKLKGPKICVVEPVQIKAASPPEALKENSLDRRSPITAADSKIVKHKPPTPPAAKRTEAKRTKETTPPDPSAKPPLPVKKTAAVAPRPPALPPKSDLTIHRVVVKQQEILPVKVASLQRAEPQRARLETRPASPSLEPPRRPSRESLSVSQPTSPVAPARGLRSSELRKSLSIRLGRRPEAQSPASRTEPASSSSSRGSDLRTSTKSADTTSRARKDKEKCVIS